MDGWPWLNPIPQRGSDITGYLWTDAELVIGGHDLLAELESEVGRWCYLTIRYSKGSPDA